MSGLTIFGERVTGQEVRNENTMAALSIANVLKSSLGPVGLDKMLVDELGDVTITNDGATMLSQLDVKHPAGKVLVELSRQQDNEVGDGTTSVVLLAAELIKRANELISNSNIHPTVVIAGYNIAKHQASKYLSQELAIRPGNTANANPVSTTTSTSNDPASDSKQQTFKYFFNINDKTLLSNIAKTALSSKVIGVGSKERDKFANMVVEALVQSQGQAANTNTNTSGINERTLPLSSINVIKMPGGSYMDSELINGYVLNGNYYKPPGTVRRVSSNKGVKIAFLDIDLRKSKMPLGVSILVKDATNLQQIHQKESDITKNRIITLLKAGANVVVTSKGIDDQFIKYFNEYQAMPIKRVGIDELKALAKSTGGSVIYSLSEIDEEKSLINSNDSTLFGTCEDVMQQRIGDNELLLFTGCKIKNSSSYYQSIILRGGNEYVLEEVARSMHDALCALKRALDSSSLVAGAGSVETALSVYLDRFAETMGSREQLAMSEFAQALLVIPKTLAVNAALDATELVAKLFALHSAYSNTDAKRSEYKFYGLDLNNGTLTNAYKAGILEPAIGKIKQLKFATEAAVALLRIDDSIKMKPKVDPKTPHGY